MKGRLDFWQYWLALTHQSNMLFLCLFFFALTPKRVHEGIFKIVRSFDGGREKIFKKTFRIKHGSSINTIGPINWGVVYHKSNNKISPSSLCQIKNLATFPFSNLPFNKFETHLAGIMGEVWTIMDFLCWHLDAILLLTDNSFC